MTLPCVAPSVHVLRQEGGRSRLYGLLNGDGQVEEKKQEGEDRCLTPDTPSLPACVTLEPEHAWQLCLTA